MFTSNSKTQIQKGLQELKNKITVKSTPSFVEIIDLYAAVFGR